MSSRAEDELQHRLEEDERQRQQLAAEAEDRRLGNFSANETTHLGKLCEQFKESDVGKYILDRSIRDSEKAMQDMVDADASNFRSLEAYAVKMAELKFEARLPNLVWVWIAEAINAGIDADRINDQQHNEGDLNAY